MEGEKSRNQPLAERQALWTSVSHKCGRVGHWARNCPNKHADKSPASSKSAAAPKSSTASCVAVVWEGSRETLLVSSPGFGNYRFSMWSHSDKSIDLGTSCALQEQKRSQPELRAEENLLCFGNGQEELSTKVARLLIAINGHSGYIDAAVIQGDAPLLLSRSTMKSLDGVLTFAEETISVKKGPPQPLQTNSAGQYIINVMCYNIPLGPDLRGK